MYIYVVEKGDVLWKIADHYDTNIDEIIKLNNLKDPDLLLVGESLLIPTENSTYMVMPGDTLWMIAQKYGIPVQDIIAVNPMINPDMIYPNTMINIPRREKPTIDVNGFTYFLGEDGSEVVDSLSPYLTYISPFAYIVKEDGNLEPINDEPIISSANQDDVVPIMVIVNFAYNIAGENIADSVLNNLEFVENLQNNIINEMKEKGYKGLNVDFEYVLPKDQYSYNMFLRTTAEKLHNEGFFLSTSLAPKTSAEQRGLLYEAHDYEIHGDIADFVVLMTYEWGWRGGPPRAISPVNEMERVLDYAVSVIPKDKILMGFQIYARDWTLPFSENRPAETISIQDAIDLAKKHKVQIQYDYTAQSPFFRYADDTGNIHEVWFEDARSAQAKFDLVRDYDLKGLSYWGLGYDFPQNWYLLEDNFNIRKIENNQ